ncbi:hypothetical protein MLD38_032860 [Melastoma candidum]|uniref:Uncharacterized protein n=1 Tax=Melastoma candidum TaxID=119954 RepID=A0ACB9M764_9MYRT|nr:hypothetical protein MLD38_032860 [Melastoma candidum]
MGQSNKSNVGRRAEEEATPLADGFPVHSQVRRIKEEYEGMIDRPPSPPPTATMPGQDEAMRPPSSRGVMRHRSRSPLGLSSSSSASGRPISVGD